MVKGRRGNVELEAAILYLGKSFILGEHSGTSIGQLFPQGGGGSREFWVRNPGVRIRSSFMSFICSGEFHVCALERQDHGTHG